MTAFVEHFRVEPTASGPLDGLTFAVKDILDVAGHRTGCGNPTWRESHPDAVCHAICVEQLLAAGAAIIGKTITDQLAFSLIGENHWYGTPPNPQAPDRVPGGSSSGSASAVASGECDLALGSDTGGSVRVPASNCGIFGWRPTHGRVNIAGAMPFAPSFDTIGLFTRTGKLLARSASVLLAESFNPEPVRYVVLRDAFTHADAEVSHALADHPGDTEIRLADLSQGQGPAWSDWFEVYSVTQWAEIWCTLGPWVESAKPDFGPVIAASFDLPRELDRKRVGPAMARRERLARAVAEQLGPRDVLVMPTTPTLAPKRGEPIRRDAGAMGYYPRTIGYTALAGIARLPQVSIPWAKADGVPVGLSLIAAPGRDALVLTAAEQLRP